MTYQSREKGATTRVKGKHRERERDDAAEIHFLNLTFCCRTWASSIRRASSLSVRGIPEISPLNVAETESRTKGRAFVGKDCCLAMEINQVMPDNQQHS